MRKEVKRKESVVNIRKEVKRKESVVNMRKEVKRKEKNTFPKLLSPHKICRKWEVNVCL
jgi:hypothetical protein